MLGIVGCLIELYQGNDAMTCTVVEWGGLPNGRMDQ